MLVERGVVGKRGFWALFGNVKNSTTHHHHPLDHRMGILERIAAIEHELAITQRNKATEV